MTQQRMQVAERRRERLEALLARDRMTQRVQQGGAQCRQPGPRGAVQAVRERLDAAAGGAQLVLEPRAGGVGQRRAPRTGLDQRRLLLERLAELPDLVAFARHRERRALAAHDAGHAQQRQSMQHAAARAAFVGQQVERQRAAQHDAERGQFVMHRADERRLRRARREFARDVAGQRIHRLDQHRIGAGPQRPAIGPRQRRVERVLHQRAGQRVEPVATQRTRVAAQARQPFGPHVHGNQVGRRYRQLARAQPLHHVLEHAPRGLFRAVRPDPLVIGRRRHARRVARERVEAPERVRHEIGTVANAARGRVGGIRVRRGHAGAARLRIEHGACAAVD